MLIKKIAIIGYGGFSDYVSEIIEALDEYKVVGFIGCEGNLDTKYNDSNLKELKADGVSYIANGIGNIEETKDETIKLLNKYLNYGFKFPTIIHPSAVVSKSSSLGMGVMVMENAVIKTKAKVGKFCVINALAVVSHGCSVGDYSHLSLGSKTGGDVKIGTNVFLGINSSVNQQIKIESNSVIGSGSVIINNVIKNSIVVGNPGKIIKMRTSGN